MSLNQHIQTPYGGDFTLESLGLATQDHLNADGVLGMQEPLAPAAVIQTDMTGANEGVTSMADSEVEQLPEWDSKIRIVKENADKIVDMKAIQKDIEQSDTMTSDRAHEIQATFEGFFNDHNKPGHYTPFESKTGLAYAKRFMDEKITASMEALITEFRESHAGSIGDLARALDTTRDFCADELRDIINDAINKISAVHAQLKEGAIVLPFNGDTFIDMTTANLMDVDVDQIKQGVPVSEEFKVAFNTMKDLWKQSHEIRNTIILMADVASHSDLGDPPCNMESLYIKTICHAFREDTSSFIMDQGIEYVEQADERIQEKWDTVKQPIMLTSESFDIISSQSKDLLQESNKAAMLQKEMMDIGKFATACSTVVLGLVSLR